MLLIVVQGVTHRWRSETAGAIAKFRLPLLSDNEDVGGYFSPTSIKVSHHCSSFISMSLLNNPICDSIGHQSHNLTLNRTIGSR